MYIFCQPTEQLPAWETPQQDGSNE